jgi:sortase A
LFGSAAGPIISYELFTAPRFQPPELIAPAAANQAFVLGDNSTVSVDLTKINSWFPTAPARSETSVKINTYTLSIPKLRIADSSVKIGGEDLAKSLVHYAGTALPGQPGNAVIIGHSVLPQFFDPKNYLSIFSTLPRLRPGDDFFISYDGIQYRYVVEDMVEVDPTNFTVLEQRFDDAFATLITCVPPGLKTKRLAVRARLVNNLNPI